MDWTPDVPERTIGWKTIVVVLAIGVVTLMAWMWPEPDPPSMGERVAARCDIHVADLTYLGGGRSLPVITPYGRSAPRTTHWYEDADGDRHAVRSSTASSESIECNAEGY